MRRNLALIVASILTGLLLFLNSYMQPGTYGAGATEDASASAAGSAIEPSAQVSNSGTVPLKLGDIREGTLVRKIKETGLYEILPQLEMRVRIKIDGMVASTTIEQAFTNPSKQPVEAIYVFPLPEDSAVHDMKMLINDRLIQGVIREKKEAKKVYEKAKREGKRAGLTEQERPNIFTSSVANIMPGDTIIVRLQYMERLDYRDGVFQLRFPMVVAPRYIPGSSVRGYSGSGWAYDTDVVSDASRVTPPVIPPGMRSGNMVSLEVALDAGLPISSIRSISHGIGVEQVRENIYRIGLKQKKVIPNKDFILEYRIEPGSEPKAALFTSEMDNGHYFMLMAVPPVNLENEQTIKKEMIFLVDVSGSMSGVSIEQAKAGLANALRRLNPGDYFNIITFNDQYFPMETHSIEATRENISRGLGFAKGLEAAGGTEAQPALRHALLMKSQPDRVKMIVFLTDGSVGNEDELISLVRMNIKKGRLFAVGIGPAPNGHLLKKVSQFGRGTFTYISKKSEVEERMNGLLSKIERPVLTDLRLDLHGQAEILPDPIPDLFAGEPLVLFGKLSGGAEMTATLTGRAPQGYFRLELPLDLKSGEGEPAIPVLWARSRISNLMDEYRLGSKELKDDIVKLAVKYRLLSRFTSFVAVEHRIVNPQGNFIKSAMPTLLPEGWEFEKVFEEKSSSMKAVILPQTASTAPHGALSGFILILLGLLLIFVKALLQRKLRVIDAGCLER